MLIASERLDLHNKLDNDMFNHIVLVTNRVLLLAKYEGTKRESLISMGKYIWRLIRVIQAYNSKRRNITLEELLGIVNEFKSVFGG